MSTTKAKNGAASPNPNEFQFEVQEKETFLEMIYNPKTGAVLGRTGKNWAQLLLFYAIFYAILAALFAVCMQGLFLSLKENRPTYVLERSLIGTNPGLGYRPLTDDTVRGSVIQFSTKKPDTYNYWVSLLDSYLEPYINNQDHATGGTNQKVCDFDTRVAEDEVCAVNMDKFGICSKNSTYGYDRGTPCIFLKLNKIFDWIPEYYDNITDLPEDMPLDLQSHIKSLPEAQRKQVWVSCKGQYKSDLEMIGPIEYIPSPGIPAYYYPYRNVPGYLSPLIAVRFSRPAVNQLIHVECRAWAKNILYSGSLRDRKGSVVFELLID